MNHIAGVAGRSATGAGLSVSKLALPRRPSGATS